MPGNGLTLFLSAITMETSRDTSELHLDDLEERPARVTASVWLRAINFGVDSFIFYIVVILIQSFLIPPSFFASLPRSFFHPLISGLPDAYTALALIFWSFVYVLYYTLQETFLDGQTLGKRLTATEVTSLPHGPITFPKALLRSVSRLIPLDIFFALTGTPLHDRLSKTTVMHL